MLVGLQTVSKSGHYRVKNDDRERVSLIDSNLQWNWLSTLQWCGDGSTKVCVDVSDSVQEGLWGMVVLEAVGY